MWFLIGALSVAAPAPATDYRASLASLPPTWQAAGDWLVNGGPWRADEGGLVGRDGGAELAAVPALAAGRCAVTLTPRTRLRPGGWAVAALRLIEVANRYWQLDVVEDPDGATRRVELVEMYDETWQAQTEPDTRLEMHVDGALPWQWGGALRVELEWSNTGITARAKPVAAAVWAWTASTTFGGVTAVRGGRPGLWAGDAEALFRDVEVSGTPAVTRTVSGDGAVVMADAARPEVTDRLAKLAADAGYAVRRADAGTLDTALDPQGDRLLLAPSLERLPRPAFDAVTAWVAHGGALLATGGEPFAATLHRTADGQWKTAEEVLATVQGVATALDPSHDLPLRHASSEAKPDVTLTFGQRGPTGAADALTLALPRFAGWFTLAKFFDASPFGADRALTVVWVKGTPGQATTVEWKEGDESRWIATVPLTADWRKHVLRPADFVFWPDGSPPARRDTTFRPAAAKALSFGPANGFGAHDGPFEMSLGPIMTAPAPAELADVKPPVWETFSPWYKQYETQRGGKTVRVPVARPRGATLAAETEGRFACIGPVTAPEATRYQLVSGGCLWWLPSTDLSADGRTALVEQLKRARRGVFLLNGGPQEPVLWHGEQPVFGARLLNTRAAPVKAQLTSRVWSGSGTVTHIRDISLAPGALRGTSTALKVFEALPLPVGECTVTTTVEVDGEVADEVTGPLRIIDPEGLKHADRRVRAHGDRFEVGGKPIFLDGVNYWPRYVSGMEPGRYSRGWLLPQNYDAELVEADLAEMERLGLNLISLHYSDPAQGRCLVDFLLRCRRHGVYTNLYLGSANALGFQPDHDRALIDAARLAGNDTVAFYDLHWEPHFGDHAARRKWDSDWRAWIVEQYGSVAAAEAAWGMAAPIEDGQVTNPSDDQVSRDGPHRILVAAYRRFQDDLISRRYGRVCRSLKSMDPDTLLGARTGYGGTGHEWPARVMAYDLTSGAAHLDFVSPEGYGMSDDWAKARGMGFVTAYGKWAGAGKPVFWAEFGQSIGARGGNPAALATQAAIWDSTLHVCADSGAAADAGWWWPGGWRVDERSDYGVLSPDGTPRPALLRAAAWRKRLPAPPPATQERLTIDRDADARALAGLWPAHEAEYLAAKARGADVVLVTAGTGTTTRTMPLVQVGDVPYAGWGPLQYANAEVETMHVTWPGGSADVDNGGSVKLPAGVTASVEVHLLNSGEAAWSGCALTIGGKRVEMAADVPRFGRVTLAGVTLRAGQTIAARLTTAAGAPFGETLRLNAE
jgi:hypothetical protein